MTFGTGLENHYIDLSLSIPNSLLLGFLCWDIFLMTFAFLLGELGLIPRTVWANFKNFLCYSVTFSRKFVGFATKVQFFMEDDGNQG